MLTYPSPSQLHPQSQTLSQSKFQFPHMNLTHNDHLVWYLATIQNGYLQAKHFAKRKSLDERFVLRFGEQIENCKSWAEELKIAAQKLVDVHGTKLALFYSGGSDSEVVLRTLLGIGVIPEVHVIEFDEGLNAHEVKNAFELCRANNIKPVVWHHDTMKYVKEHVYRDMALTYHCSQIAYLTVLEYARRTDRPVIMGGEIYVQKHQHTEGGRVHDEASWYYIYREDEDGVTYRYSMATGHPVINEFFTYTPNLLYSWLVHPTIKSVMNNEVPGKLTLLSIKRKVYEQELGYNLTAQTKFHGYEALTWVNAFVQRELRAELPPTQTCRYEYNQLVTDLCCSQPFSAN